MPPSIRVHWRLFAVQSTASDVADPNVDALVGWGMPKKRWIAPWAESEDKASIYYISRVVDLRFIFGDEEREAFRMFMSLYENFTGCRVLSYCVMSNHFHILLEVPPMPESLVRAIA